MKAFIVLMATFALLVLMVGSAAAFEPNGPATVPDRPEFSWGGPTMVVPDAPDTVPDGPEVVPDAPDIEPNNEVVPDAPEFSWGGPTFAQDYYV